ncbi:hypothetical protein [Halorubrum sp. HHNYT27]|uniref:hypothetical protein n=1 Tax=Halorubrum sp. HHNYT27 TaxID=3402275 RepID=UPI003EB90621
MALPLRRSLRAMALVALVLSAGCTALPVTDGQASGPDSTVDDFSYPSGWSQDGIADLSVALRTHEETLHNTSRRSRLAIVDEDGNRTVVRTFDAENGTVSVRWSDTQFGGPMRYYFSAEGAFEYDPATGELTRNPDERWTPAGVASQEGVRRPLTELDLDATETVTVEGRTAVRYNVTGIEDPVGVPADNATGHVVVTEAGYIAAYNVTRGNDGFSRRTTYEVTDFGNATVTRPAWLPEE